MKRVDKFAVARSNFLKLFLLGVLVLATGRFAAAQNLASINGKVQDSSGAAVPDTAVTVTSAETGTTRAVTSDDQGDYRVLSIPVGVYEIKAEKTGFKTRLQSGVQLVVGQQAVVNLTMEVGQVQQQVTVTADVPVVNTSTVSTAGLVQEQQIKDLPLNGRSFDNLITLNAGAANVTTEKTAGAGALLGNLFSISGRQYFQNIFLINGVDYPGPNQPHSVPGGVSGQLLGIDAVREFNVQSNAYDAQYGQRSGGQINVVTQSGTNAVHGSVFEFIRNSVFDARNFFDHPVGIRIPQFKRNQFGGALGGPVRKDKTFLFGNYEGFRQRLGISDALFVPDANADVGLTDAGLPPTGSTLCPAGAPYPGQVAGQTPYAPGMLAYLNSYWPKPNGTCIGNGISSAFYNPNSAIREDFGIVRLDENFSGKDTLSASHLFDDGHSLVPQLNPNFGTDSRIRTQVFSMQETHIFSPNLINIATIGYSLSFWHFQTPSLVPIPASLDLVAGRLLGRFAIGGTGSASSSTISSGGGGKAIDTKTHTARTTYADAINWSKGRHQFGAGIWLMPLYSNETFPSQSGGNPVFTGLAQFMLGQFSSFGAAPIITPQHWHQLQGAWYVQDIIQLKSNLTVRLGLRHEFTNGWTNGDNEAVTFQRDPTTGILLTNPTIGKDFFNVNNTRWLFGPRVGIAWDPFGKGKTSIRAGFGIHYDIFDSMGYALDNAPPFNGIVSYPNTTPFLSLVPISPSTPIPQTCGLGVVGACTTYAVSGDPADLKTPAVDEWNLSVEQGITANMSLTVGYVGSHMTHGILNMSPDAVAAITCASATCTAGGTGGSKTSKVSQGMLYVPVGTLPNPFLANGGNYLVSENNSSYNALEVGLKNRLSHGLQFQVNYTWSRAEDFDSGYSADSGNENASLLQPYNPRADWGPAGYNKTNKFSANFAYQLPFGQGKRWMGSSSGAVNKVVSGWQLNGIFTATSGFPFEQNVGSSISGDGDIGAPDRPYWNPSFTGNVINGGPDHYFNPNAFTICPVALNPLANPLACTATTTAYGTYGNVGRNVLNAPGLVDLDMSIFKNTSITERVKAEFRVEGFNILNRANFGTPGLVLYSGTTVSPTAGAITTTATSSRQLQFGLKILF